MELSSGQPRRCVLGMITAESRRVYFSFGFGTIRDGPNNFGSHFFLHFLSMNGKELPLGWGAQPGPEFELFPLSM